VAPTTDAKPKQFAFIMSTEEHEMLQELAEADGRSASGWLRQAIRVAHAGLPKKKRTKR